MKARYREAQKGRCVEAPRYCYKQGAMGYAKTDYMYVHKTLLNLHTEKVERVFRRPKKGDWYLSGAIPEAYQALENLTTLYYILLQRPERRTSNRRKGS